MRRSTLMLILGTAGCASVGIRGPGTLGPEGSQPDRIPPISTKCQVGVVNETAVALDVTYVTVAPNGVGRSGKLGRLEINDTRTIQALCGETVTAYGRGPGVSARGAAVARQFDDVWIRLTKLMPEAPTIGASIGTFPWGVQPRSVRLHQTSCPPGASLRRM